MSTINRFDSAFDYASTLRAALEISCDNRNYSPLARKVLGEFASDLIQNFRIDDKGATRIEKPKTVRRHDEKRQEEGRT